MGYKRENMQIGCWHQLPRKGRPGRVWASCSEYLEVDLNFRHAYLWEPKRQAKESASPWERFWLWPAMFLLWVGAGLLRAAHPHRHHTLCWDLNGRRTGQGPSLWQSGKRMMRCFLAFGSSKVWWFTADLRFRTGSSFAWRAWAVCPVWDWESLGLRARAEGSRQEGCCIGCLTWIRICIRTLRKIHLSVPLLLSA